MSQGHQESDELNRKAKPSPRDGEHVSAEELFRSHASYVAAFLGRLGVSAAEIDDLVQEVFLVVHRKGGFEVGAAQPKTWLGAIAVRVASTRRRSLGRRREHANEEVLQAAVSPNASPDERLHAKQSLARVQQALSSLDLDHRAVFVLYEIEGQSCQDISRALEVPTGTVYSRLHHARKRFGDAHAALLEAETAKSIQVPAKKAMRSA